MEILEWIDKSFSEIQHTLLFGRYFDSIQLEKGTDVYYLFNGALGIDIIINENYIVKSIHFYSGKQNNINQFSDKLPLNLTFSLSRDETRKILGEPKKQGGGDFSILYGVTPAWDKYLFKNFTINLQFDKNKMKIDLVTVDSLNLE